MTGTNEPGPEGREWDPESEGISGARPARGAEGAELGIGLPARGRR